MREAAAARDGREVLASPRPIDVQRDWVKRKSKEIEETPATGEEPREERVWLKRGKSVKYKEATLTLSTGELRVEGDSQNLQITQVTPQDKTDAVLLRTASGTVRVRFNSKAAMRSWSSALSESLEGA